MPIRNGDCYLREAIESILNQSIAELELVAVDDGSTDKTPHLLRDFASRDPRIRVFQQRGEGMVAALNVGVANARAPLIARMDCDDVASADRLERQISSFEGRPTLVALGGQAIETNDTGAQRRFLRYPVGPRACRQQLELSSPFCHPAVMFRKGAVLAVGGYRTAYRHAEDYDLWLRLSQVGELDNLSGVVLKYRRHVGSTTYKNAKEQAQSTALAVLAARLRSRGLGDPTPDNGWADASLSEALATIQASISEEHLAQLVYWRTLVLNGALANPAELSAFRQVLPHLTDVARQLKAGRTFAFMMLRAASLAARTREWLLAGECVLRSAAAAPAATAEQIIQRLARRPVYGDYGAVHETARTTGAVL